MRISICLIIFFIFSTNNNLFSQWILQSPKPTGYDLNTVCFKSQNKGWAAGKNGSLIKTTDGGNNWFLKQLQTKNNINRIYFRDSLNGYALCDSGKYFNTTDGGESWITINFATALNMNDILFNGNEAYICGFSLIPNEGAIYKSTNGGIDWQLSYQGGSYFERIKFINASTGYAFGRSRFALKTTNAGGSWNVKYINAYDMEFIDTSTFFLSYGGLSILKTTNGGQNYSTVLSHSNYLGFIYKLSPQILFVIGYDGSVFKSTNYGDNWTVRTGPLTSNFGAGYIYDTSNCYIVGKKGLILKSENGGLNWVSYNNIPATTLHRCYFADSKTGWVSGDKVILRTTNGGNNWQIKWLDSASGFQAFSYINESEAWVMKTQGYNGVASLFKTTNGGNNWNFITTLSYPPYNNLTYSIYQLQFISDSVGWFCGTSTITWSGHSFDQGIIGRTIDGGYNWSYTFTYNTVYVNDIRFLNKNSGWAVGSNNGILKTTNGGLSWNGLLDNYTYQIHYASIALFDTSNIYLLGYSGTFYDNNNAYLSKSTNSGTNWAGDFIYYNNSSYRMFFLNMYTGWVSGSNGTLYATSNGGSSWNRQPTPTNNGIWNICFLDKDTGWAVGENGTIMKTTSGITSSVYPAETAIVEDFELYQNYPNPFNAFTKIRYNLKNRAKVVINIYNILGQKVLSIGNDQSRSGINEVIADLSGFSSGVYFCQLIVNNKSSNIRRMVLLK